MRAIGCIAACIFLCLGTSAFAGHPLITDDTGVQGAGKFQFELNGQASRNNDGRGVIEQDKEAATALTYGVTDAVDVAVGVPWQKTDLDDNGQATSTSGLSDVGIAVKWRFFEKDGLSLALKPGITFATGDYEKGLGNGKATASLFLISTNDINPFLPLTLNMNLGYIRNENKGQDRVDIWHASFAAVYAAAKTLQIVADIGTETNPDQESDTNPAYLLGGLIYSVNETLDLDFGVKGGLNKKEPDFTTLYGITARW
jgi:hypothetical protein